MTGYPTAKSLDPGARDGVAGVFLCDVNDGAHFQSSRSVCAAMSVGRSRNSPFAHSSAGPGACSGLLPQYEWIGGPLPTFGEDNLLNTDSEIGNPFPFRNGTSCCRVISGSPSIGASADFLRRVLRPFSISESPVEGILI